MGRAPLRSVRIGPNRTYDPKESNERKRMSATYGWRFIEKLRLIFRLLCKFWLCVVKLQLIYGVMGANSTYNTHKLGIIAVYLC